MGFNPKYLIMLGLLFVLMIMYYFYFEHKKSQQLIEKQSKRITELEDKVTNLIKKPPPKAASEKKKPEIKTKPAPKPAPNHETTIYEITYNTDKPINLKGGHIGPTEAAEIEQALNGHKAIDAEVADAPTAHEISESRPNIFDVEPTSDEEVEPTPMMPPKSKELPIDTAELSQLEKPPTKMVVNAVAAKKLSASGKKK
jgi:hypothetical protein